jgi:hypothetical protein
MALRGVAGKFLVGLSGVALAASAIAVTICSGTAGHSAPYGALTSAVDACTGVIADGNNLTHSSSSSVQGKAHATADLATGVLTAISSGTVGNTGVEATASIWDTFTFNNLPGGSSSITALLALTGSMTGSVAFGSALFYTGTNLGNLQTYSFNAATQVPASVQYTFLAVNGVPIKLNTEIHAYLSGNSNISGVADLQDPPTLSLLVPVGTVVSSSSGVFQNVVPTTAVPEPAPLLLMLGGLMCLSVRKRLCGDSRA